MTAGLSCLLAVVFSVPALPPVEYDDTEVVTNTTIHAIRSDARLFDFTLELDATPSNNVEIAFGREADADGELSRQEETLLVGWDCGEWKVVDCATGNEVCEEGTCGRTRLDWLVRFDADGVPGSLEATVGGNAAFADLAANPPRFVFSPDWNMVRVVGRGLDSLNPSVSGSIRQVPFAVRIR